MGGRNYCSALDNFCAFSPSDLKAYEAGVLDKSRSIVRRASNRVSTASVMSG